MELTAASLLWRVLFAVVAIQKNVRDVAGAGDKPEVPNLPSDGV